jgi:hypothetical protein
LEGGEFKLESGCAVMMVVSPVAACMMVHTEKQRTRESNNLDMDENLILNLRRMLKILFINSRKLHRVTIYFAS